jgi:surface antigen
MMRFQNVFCNHMLIAPLLLASVLGAAVQADAATRHAHSHHHRLAASQASAHHSARSARRVSSPHGRMAERRHGHERHRVAWQSRHGHAGLQCVPYARHVSGIELTGNAYGWWREADGRYARGQMPAEHAILSFKRSGRMPLGHVAVVTETVNPREVLVTQANWPSYGWRGGDISKAVSVIDVSPSNDWTEVRVQVGHSAVYGSVYRTNGFIYGHAPPETLMAAASGKASPAGAPKAGAAGWGPSVQLASAPSYGEQAIATSAPDRQIR